mmetsp:Transcript_14886/g.37029  ORF Transcript_14886/g.37029 Transcript_14886/m.37029 type:complete len:227 (-) Transcript_14886:962-1642(-)
MEDVTAVASEDVCLVVPGQLHQSHLIGLRQDGHEAIQAGARHLLALRSCRHLVFGPATSDECALPICWNGDVRAHPSSLLDSLRATNEVFILDDAREADVATEPVLRARGPCPSAARRDESAVAQGLAIPILMVTRALARVHASGVGLVLLEAGHAARAAAGAAAMALGAVLARARARVRHAGHNPALLGGVPHAPELAWARVLRPECGARGQAFGIFSIWPPHAT